MVWGSCLLGGGLRRGDELVDPGDAAAPEGLQLGEHHAHRPHRLHVSAGQGLTTLPTLGQQARALLAWYRTSARDLPWRSPGTSAWAVLVSEVMLQQTTTAHAAPYYARFLARWPTVLGLAFVFELFVASGVSPFSALRVFLVTLLHGGKQTLR